jgi:hypothetical protein
LGQIDGVVDADGGEDVLEFVDKPVGHMSAPDEFHGEAKA